MSLYLAVDAGGTKTDYALADDDRVLARVRGGTIKRMRAGAEVTAANLYETLQQLQAESGLSLAAVDCTCIGTAGNTVPLVTDWLRQEFAGRVGGELILLGDVEIALDAAFAGGPGVLVMAGTGSNVAGRAAHGEVLTAGGWGPALADQGSGHRIGQQSLRAAFLARDEGRGTRLIDEVMRFWEVGSLDRLVELANSRPGPDFSRLTPLVLQCAVEGDLVSAAVLRREGEDLGYLARLMVRRIVALSPGKELPRVAWTGSILENVAPVCQAMIAALLGEFPAIQVLDDVVDPVAGAVWRARQRRTSSIRP